MIIASARLSVAFDWWIGGLLLFHLQLLLRSPAAATGDRWLQLCGLGWVSLEPGLAWFSSACLFSVTFRISFHVIARAWQQFQLGPSFWSVFKAQLATTSLPLRSRSPLGPLDPLARCRRQYALWSLAYCMKFVYTHTCMLGVCLCVCVCLFVSVWVWMNQARSFELRFIIFCSARCFFLLIYTIIFYTPPPSPLTIPPPPLTSFKSRRLIV